jgi:diguanylate cyclase (GGDEF)-like protein
LNSGGAFGSRARRDAVRGALLALGAPAGLLVVRAYEQGGLGLEVVVREITSHPLTYGYVAFSTLVAFGLFGYTLGRQADRLYALARYDTLTGLHNRRAFEERLRDELARGERHAAPLALLLVDVDGLKERNDRLGHRAGDEALVAVARGIELGCRRTDVAARWGGDEFAVLAPQTGRSEAAQLAERVREQAAAFGEGVTVSVGVEVLPAGEARPPEALLRAADGALYEAKRAGRNRVVLAVGPPSDGAYTPAP